MKVCILYLMLFNDPPDELSQVYRGKVTSSAAKALLLSYIVPCLTLSLSNLVKCWSNLNFNLKEQLTETPLNIF